VPAPSEPHLIDVDSMVIQPEELVRRVREVLAATDTSAVPLANPPAWGNVPGDPLPSAERRAATLHRRYGELRQPPLAAAPGAVGRSKHFAKRVVRKATRWYVEPRWETQAEFDAESARLASDLTLGLRRLHGDLATVRQELGELTAHQAAAETAAAQARETTESHVGQLRTEVATLLERLGAASASGAAIDYVAFEDRFRGASADLREVQAEYLPYFGAPEAPGLVIDIGCGRGEMLELLTGAGHRALGIDVDAAIVAACREKGLEAVHANALDWFGSAEDGSLKGVFCAQVVEHLLTSELELLVRLAHAKLAPGGVLVVETINPRSLHALGNHF
jgi:2-polyprenyl-3-methyl-5-hydroxy-6-metoxy-1,4-benzoquinol methylase